LCVHSHVRLGLLRIASLDAVSKVCIFTGRRLVLGPVCAYFLTVSEHLRPQAIDVRVWGCVAGATRIVTLRTFAASGCGHGWNPPFSSLNYFVHDLFRHSIRVDRKLGGAVVELIKYPPVVFWTVKVEAHNCSDMGWSQPRHISLQPRCSLRTPSLA
jgi:hypothetical protein